MKRRRVHLFWLKGNKHMGQFKRLGIAMNVNGLDVAKANVVLQSEHGHLILATEKQFNERFVPIKRGE